MSERLRTWLAVLAVAIGLYWVGRWQGAARIADLTAVTNAQNLLHVKASYLKRLGELQQIETQHQSAALRWRHRADSLRALALALQPIGAGMSTRVDTIMLSSDTGVAATWRIVADAEHHAAAECFVSVSACQQRATLAEDRAAALDSSLAGLLRVKDCHVWFVKCPSRWASVVVGAGLGFLGGVWTGKH